MREVAHAEVVGFGAVVDAGDPGGAVADVAGEVAGGEDDGGGAVGDGRAVVHAERGGDVGIREHRFYIEVAGDLRGGVGLGVAAGAGGDFGHVALGAAAGVEHGARLEGGEGDAVGPEGLRVVGVELEGEDVGEVAERGLAEGVDEGGVDVAALEANPGFVEGPGAVHLDVGFADGGPGADGVEGHDEGEGLAGEVVAGAGDGEADLLLGDVGLVRASVMTGMSISTSLCWRSWRSYGVDCAKPTTATSRMGHVSLGALIGFNAEAQRTRRI